MLPICEVAFLGRIAYADAWALQDRLSAERAEGRAPDRLLLLEHPPTYTLGTSGRDEHLLLPADELARRGIAVHRVDRGGDITYHGPGQIVGYPILQLERDHLRTNVVGYVRALERVLIAALARYAIAAHTLDGLTGVWVQTPAGPAKIAAIGVRVSVKAVTKHGFALNVNTDLSYFDGIVPCGIRDKGVTSMAAVLGEPQDEAAVRAALAAAFAAEFGYALVETADVFLPPTANA